MSGFTELVSDCTKRYAELHTDSNIFRVAVREGNVPNVPADSNDTVARICQDKKNQLNLASGAVYLKQIVKEELERQGLYMATNIMQLQMHMRLEPYEQKLW